MKKLQLILLVDDDDGTNLYNRFLIEECNAAEEVVIAKNGRIALDFLTNQGEFAGKGPDFPRPDIIFLDINMPVMDGFEFLEEYARLESTQKANVVVFMLTSSLNPRDLNRAGNYMDLKGFLNKPLKKEDLLRLIENSFAKEEE